jgi:hypothetical protein
MQAIKTPSGGPSLAAESRRPVSRAIAIALTVLALACGIAGLQSLSPETWGIGLIAFGCLLAIIALLAQGAEHFTREHPAAGTTTGNRRYGP